MSTFDIHLPKALKPYLDEQVAQRGYKDATEFVAALLEAERFRNVRAEVESMLLEAADGPFTEWSDADVEAIERIGKRLIARRAAAR